jgi:hypothetical protein
MKTKLLFAALLCAAAWGQTVINGSRSIIGDWDARQARTTKPFKSGSSAALPPTCTVGEMYFAIDGVNGRNLLKCSATDTWNSVIYDQGTANPATCTIGQIFFRTDVTASQNLFMCTATNTWTQQLNSGENFSLNPGCSFDGAGSTIALNSICYSRVRAGCTLSSSYQIIAVGAAPTATINVLKVASGTALPTSSIVSSSMPTLAAGNAVVGATVWTTAAITPEDILAFKVTAVSNATWLDISLKCN